MGGMRRRGMRKRGMRRGDIRRRGMRRRGMRFGCAVSEERGAELDSTRTSILAVMALIHKGAFVLPHACTPPTQPQSRELESHAGC